MWRPMAYQSRHEMADRIVRLRRPASREGEGTEERGSGSARDGKLCMRT